jgi:hypothetical protein
MIFTAGGPQGPPVFFKLMKCHISSILLTKEKNKIDMKQIMMFLILLIAPMLGSAFAQEAAGVMGAPFTGKFLDSEYFQTQGTGESQTVITTTPERKGKIAIYPILVQAPIFGTTIDLPSLPNGPGIITGTTDTSLEGAYMGGFTLDRDKLYVDFNILWGSFSADRSRPHIDVNTDASFVDLAVGWRFYHDLAITGGFRYVGVKLDAQIEGLPTRFEIKPHEWDPLIGVDWRHYKGDKWIFDANFQGGGFGVGSEVDISAEGRVDWMFARHFGVQFGYGIIHYKIKVADVNIGGFQREVDFKQTLNGPKFGLGIYF